MFAASLFKTPTELTPFREKLFLRWILISEEDSHRWRRQILNIQNTKKQRETTQRQSLCSCKIKTVQALLPETEHNPSLCETQTFAIKFLWFARCYRLQLYARQDSCQVYGYNLLQEWFTRLATAPYDKSMVTWIRPQPQHLHKGRILSF
jgi:hypothetical protein